MTALVKTSDVQHQFIERISMTYSEKKDFSTLLAGSNLCPNSYRGKKDDVLIAIQMGEEVGLKPMQAVQNISVINGKPSVWGDAALALCQNHPLWGGSREMLFSEIIGLENSDNPMDAYILAHIPTEKRKLRGALFAVQRKGEPIHVQTFTEDDAKEANLWGKTGTWKTHPDRMLKMRARGFALRDKFADALKGMITTEEAQDYEHDRPVSVPRSIKSVGPKVIEGQGEFVQNLPAPSLSDRFEKFVKWYEGQGYARDDLYVVIDCNDESKLTEEHMAKLRDNANAIKEQKAAEEQFKADRAARLAEQIMNEKDDDIKF